MILMPKALYPRDDVDKQSYYKKRRKKGTLQHGELYEGGNEGIRRIY